MQFVITEKVFKQIFDGEIIKIEDPSEMYEVQWDLNQSRQLPYISMGGAKLVVAFKADELYMAASFILNDGSEEEPFYMLETYSLITGVGGLVAKYVVQEFQKKYPDKPLYAISNKRNSKSHKLLLTLGFTQNNELDKTDIYMLKPIY